MGQKGGKLEVESGPYICRKLVPNPPADNEKCGLHLTLYIAWSLAPSSGQFWQLHCYLFILFVPRLSGLATTLGGFQYNIKQLINITQELLHKYLPVAVYKTGK